MRYRLRVRWIHDNGAEPTTWRWDNIEPAWTHADDMLLVRHPEGPNISIRRAQILYTEFDTIPDA